MRALIWLRAPGGSFSNPSRVIAVLLLVSAAAISGGCREVENFLKTDKTRFFSPDKLVAAPDRPSISPILPSVGLGDQHQELVPNSTFPRDGDWSYTEEDYIIGPTDVLDISVLDLFQQGLETVLRRQVSDSGYIDMPLLPELIKAKGLNKEQLKDVIKEAYRRADVLRDATVSATIVVRQQSTFSILGAVGRPGTYSVVRRDMRLLEALAAAGGITQTNIRYVYIIRPAPALIEKPAAKKPVPSDQRPAPLPELPPEAPPATKPATKPAPEKGGNDELRRLEKILEGGPATQPSVEAAKQAEILGFTETATGGTSNNNGAAGNAARRTKWIYSDGRWIRVEEEAPPATRPSGEGLLPVRPAEKPPEEREALAPRKEAGPKDPYGWRDIEKADMARIIAINLPKLKAGDPRMNVVIRNNDVIQIPTLEVGEFYVGGDVIRPGVYSLTGRQVTVKQAVTAAGNISPIGWPENSILIRRIGDFQEQVMALNIESIFRGEEPDIYLRPDDMIVVGSDVRAPFWAVVRNAFRMTYGFGFIWDRNFADPLVAGEYTSRRFTRW